MAFWDRWLRKKKIIEPHAANDNSSQLDIELVIGWVQSIDESISCLKVELHKIPALTVAAFDENFEEKSGEIIKKLDDLPERIIGPIKVIISSSKQEILTELIRISAHYNAHDSNDSNSANRAPIIKPIREISKELTGKQKRLLALLLNSGFLSYEEIEEKLGITHESAKNFVNRLLLDKEKARLFS